MCVAIVKMDKDMLLRDNIILDLSYIQSLDRGGLKYPTYLSVMYAYRVYCVVQLLLSQRYEHKFSHTKRQKALIAALVNKSVHNDDLFMYKTEGICDASNQNLCNVLSVMLPVFVNIFLNNYTKLCNDKISAKGGKKGNCEH